MNIGTGHYENYIWNVPDGREERRIDVVVLAWGDDRAVVLRLDTGPDGGPLVGSPPFAVRLMHMRFGRKRDAV